MGTKVNPDALNRWLAEHVMEWENIPVAVCYYRHTSTEIIPIIKAQWDPYHFFDDCEALLEKIEKDGFWWEWKGPVGPEYEYVCTIRNHKEQTAIKEWADTRTAALCLAIAMEYGWEDKGKGDDDDVGEIQK